MDLDTLFFFIRLFPKLDSLELDSLYTTWENLISSQSPAIPTPTFRGKLTLCNLGSQHHPVTNSIVNHLLPMAFKDVRLYHCWFDTPEPLKDLLFECRDTLKAIEVSQIYFVRESHIRSLFTGGLIRL